MRCLPMLAVVSVFVLSAPLYASSPKPAVTPLMVAVEKSPKVMKRGDGVNKHKRGSRDNPIQGATHPRKQKKKSFLGFEVGSDH
jgi:hypothetical protein